MKDLRISSKKTYSTFLQFLWRNVVFLLLLFAVMPPKADSQIVADSSLPTILARAYSMLKVNSPEAEKLFEKAVSMDPSNALLRNQLGYLYHKKKDYESSLREFAIADSLLPSDTAKLQIAFNLISLNRQREATAVLKLLTGSKTPAVRNAAENQLATLPAGSASEWWTRIYLAPYYDTRWQTSFYQGSLQEGVYFTGDRIISGFGFLSVSGDARSKGGLSPAIFSDNALIAGVGLIAKPFTGFQFNIQQGVAYDFIKRRSRPRAMGDFRAVMVYGNGIYPDYTLHNDLRMPLTMLLDIYSSLGYYSRYRNIIGYLEARAGFRVSEVSYSAVDIYAKAGLIRDSEKQFYNNQIEGALGLRMIPNVLWGIYFVGEFHRGYYMDAGVTQNPYPKYYNSFRFFIIYDRMF